MSLREKVIEFFYYSATTTRKSRNLFTLVGALAYLTLFGLVIVFFLRLDKFLGFPEVFTFPLNLVLGLLFLVLGLVLYLSSVFYFIQARGTPIPLNPPPRLVTTGPYGRIRNPMLTGVFIMLFGLGILLQSISLLFIFTPLFILFNVWEIKAIEEPELERRLGKEYLEYKTKVPGFIPRLKGKGK